MSKKRFTIRELENVGGFVLMDGGNTMEDLEVEAERLNLLDRIASALEEIANTAGLIEARS